MSSLSYPGKVWQHLRRLVPRTGFHFDRPLVLLHSDDWGRAGLRDDEALRQLRAAGLAMGERPYDLYSLETALDLGEITSTLRRHRDAAGRSPCLSMNFVVANLDFSKMAADNFKEIHLLPLTEGLPEGWRRPGLMEVCLEGIAEGLFQPALHGTTHFCRVAVERNLAAGGERSDLLRLLWRAGVPYIHWRMPWLGYEYWDPELPADERFLPAKVQGSLIGQTVGLFTKLFSTVPVSACPPGYRANEDTLRTWAGYGVRVVQNGPGTMTPPHIDGNGILQLTRTVEFEPATDKGFSLERSVHDAEECFARGIPAIISVHSINFHSAIRDFRSRTLALLDEYLTLLKARHPDLLYLHDQDLEQLIHQGSYEGAEERVPVQVTSRKFTSAQVGRTA
jgi:hypothetical protein